MSIRIHVRRVSYTKENTPIINNISTTLTTGITYVIGKNGAGKSSFLKLIGTYHQPSEGSIDYSLLLKGGQTQVEWRSLSVTDVRKMIGFQPQHFRGHGDMQVGQYLKYIAIQKGIPKHRIAEQVENMLNKTELNLVKKKKLKQLSGGQLKKVGIVQALINFPRICLLDEPFEGLDYKESITLQRMIKRLSYHSIVVISTHLYSFIDQSDDARLLYLRNGEIEYAGEDFSILRTVSDIEE